jgi:hypothetical protein
MIARSLTRLRSLSAMKVLVSQETALTLTRIVKASTGPPTLRSRTFHLAHFTCTQILGAFPTRSATDGFKRTRRSASS